MDLRTTPTGDGGAEVTLRLTPAESEMLGDDTSTLMALLARGLWAAADLRHGVTREEWWPVVMDTSRLIHALSGIRDAALREAPGDSMSHADLARWYGESRTTIASRRQRGALPPTAPSTWETWARTGDLPPHP
ncbi:hypothetical protein AB0D16_40395 [Streptomyces sp. NPDC048161]|uniref:hypothetical protein n=1 Tax=Streptomyces sp. NPDC048161 TaxID=3160985 RepID=UPI0033EC4309